ncbi:hypothetical protein TNCV_4650981 [Trichonephila clavipes]|nr:hypothetical protein TNCV_4650981 [Trichonephila clavipes]
MECHSELVEAIGNHPLPYRTVLRWGSNKQFNKGNFIPIGYNLQLDSTRFIRGGEASRVARYKPWSTLCKNSHGIPSSPRAAAVAKFRLLTGHD